MSILKHPPSPLLILKGPSKRRAFFSRTENLAPDQLRHQGAYRICRVFWPDGIIKPMTMQNIDTSSNLQEYFYKLIRTAIENQHVTPLPETEFHLVTLLSRFAKTDKINPGEALVKLLENALEAERETRIQLLKHLGDVALYIAGYFPESLSRQLIDVDYYAQMGGTAYNSLSVLHPRPNIQSLFQELAKKFPLWMNVLSEVSIQGRSQYSERDLVRLYETWERTGSRLAQILLERAGLIPQVPGDSTH